MTLLSANNLLKSFGGHTCFEDVSFIVPAGGRVGLIGPNGCGKTTLFRVLAGEDDYEGDLSRRRGLEIARLDQSPEFPEGATPRSVMAEAVRHWRELDDAIDALRENLAVLSGNELENALRHLADMETRRDAGDGESATRRAEALLRGVGLRLDQFEQDMETLSGGERCRVALARLLVNEPDLWLLDEPTNHLDLAGIAFLERFLGKSAAAAVIISHDRQFLNNVTTETWELEGGRLLIYPGNYSQSRKLREERRQAQWREFMKQRDFMRREEMFINKWRAGTRSRQAQSRLKRLAKLDAIDEPSTISRLAALNLKLSRRLGDKVLNLYDLAVGFPGKTLFNGLKLELTPGEIVGIVGPNGSGKTTLFSTIQGEVPPLSGTVEWGPTAERGFLGQHEIFPDIDRTPLQYLQDANLGDDDQDRRDRLGAMLFSGDDVYKPVRVLSGGERKRLMLTRLLLEGHNVLLLDEPTNHLDIQSAEAVTLALTAYEGTVLVISHDRYFLDEVADRILWLEKGEWRVTRGGYAEAENAHDEAQRERARERDRDKDRDRDKKRDKPSAGPTPTTAAATPSPNDAERPYSGWRVARLESQIIKNEERMAELHAAFQDPSVTRDGNRMRTLQNELAAIEQEQTALEDEYARR